MPVSGSTAVGVSVGVRVSVGGMGVSVSGTGGVSVGETGVSVSGTGGVSVDGTGVSVSGTGGVSVDGTEVSVGVDVETGMTAAISVSVDVLVGVKSDVSLVGGSTLRQSLCGGGGENFTISTERRRAEAIPPYMQYKTFCTRGGAIRVNNTPAPLRRTANKVTVASVILYSNTQRNIWEKRQTMITTETKDSRNEIAITLPDISAER